jgi:hypothetical protein
LIIDHYEQVLLGNTPASLRINVDREARTSKTFVILQACAKVSQMASKAGKKDPIIQSAPTSVAAYNFLAAHSTLFSVYQSKVQF